MAVGMGFQDFAARPATGSPGGGGELTTLQKILELLSGELRSEDARAREERDRDRKRGFGGAAGLSDVQAALVNTRKTPQRRLESFATAATVNRGRALKSAGIDPAAPFAGPPRRDETEDEYIARMERAKRKHELEAQTAADKRRAQTAEQKARMQREGRVGKMRAITHSPGPGGGYDVTTQIGRMPRHTTAGVGTLDEARRLGDERLSEEERLLRALAGLGMAGAVGS